MKKTARLLLAQACVLFTLSLEAGDEALPKKGVGSFVDVRIAGVFVRKGNSRPLFWTKPGDELTWLCPKKGSNVLLSHKNTDTPTSITTRDAFFAGSEVRHRFLAVDSGRSRLIYVDQFHPENDWTVTVPTGPRDLRLLEGNKVLVSHKKGAAEYDLRTGNQTWNISSYSGIESAIRLPNGHTLLGSNTPAGVEIYEVDSSRTQIGKRVLPGIHDIHIVHLLKNGNLLLSRNERRPMAIAATGLYSDEHRSYVSELEPDGRIAWEAELPGPADDVDRLVNGNTLCPTGDLCTIVELNKAGKIVSTLAGVEAHRDVGIKWLASVEILKNSNILVTNWLGHGVGPVGPHLIEFDRSNRIVWSWTDHERAQMIHNSLTLE